MSQTSTTGTTASVMFAKVAYFEVDVDKLRAHHLDCVRQHPATPYRDNRVDYLGWAVTSRDGSLEDGVKRIDPKTGNNKRGVTGTPICAGYLKEVMEYIVDYGLSPYRARIMQLVSNGEDMPFHTDAAKETWRLHIPIITNPQSFFEWRRNDGSIERVHLPADGSGYLVRVDAEHRAINLSEQNCDRVHLLMGMGKPLEWDMLTEPMLSMSK